MKKVTIENHQWRATKSWQSFLEVSIWICWRGIPIWRRILLSKNRIQFSKESKLYFSE